MVMVLDDESTYDRHTIEKMISSQTSNLEGPGGRWYKPNKSLKTEQDWRQCINSWISNQEGNIFNSFLELCLSEL